MCEGWGGQEGWSWGVGWEWGGRAEWGSRMVCASLDAGLLLLLVRLVTGPACANKVCSFFNTWAGT